MPGIPFEKNDPRINREGRPKGTRNFETDFDEAVDEIAKENGMTRSEARKLLLKVAFNNAKEGNYSFYKDIHDRIYGQAKNTTDLTSDGKPIFQIINYGAENNNNPVQLPTESLPVTISEKPSEIQNSGTPQESGQIKDSTQPTDTEKPA